MKRRLKHALAGIASCTAAAAVVTTVLTSQSEKAVGTPIIVPQAQELDSSTTRSPSVSEPPTTWSTATPVDTTSTTSTTSTTPSPVHRPPAAPPPQFASSTPPKVTSVDFQAEDAQIRNGTVEWNHPGFTGYGFVDYANSVGSSVAWGVTPSAAASTNVVFRYANGGNAPRPMAIAVNGSLVASVAFPVTNGWEDWRTLAVRVNLVAGANSIIATATSQDGGPNVDKITLDAFPM